MTAASLLGLQLILFAALAGLLLLFPTLTIRALGLPPSPEPFWPRLLAGLLAGLVVATLAADQGWTRSGVGLGGYVAIDLVLAFTLVSQLVVGAAMPTRRGRAFLWLLSAVMVGLAFASIAVAT